MIPSDWVPRRRSGDGETIGYVEMVGDDVVPRGLVGNALAGPTPDWDVAEQVVDDVAMRQLGEKWVLTTDEGHELTVVVLEIDPTRVVVGHAASAQVVGRPAEDGWRIEVPTDRLRPL
ncbi:hypothetical protein [Aeromicrobium sp. Leaf350]|uniref:hypothetical protein n=1 Tax=Aeromicrobium sp. Leaf350 TaxID=2876565 RepID=UPI001E587A80|nr:hypothetical protein [Aeromicrobium sp. Leaf350]